MEIRTILGVSVALVACGINLATGQTDEYITCYANNCTTYLGNITTCQVDPGIYYPKPICQVPAATGMCYSYDWPATSNRIYGCLTQRVCPFQYTCCASGNRCNCDSYFPLVQCAQNLTSIQVYPLASQQPYIVYVDYTSTSRYYVFDVWTNFTQQGINVTFIITSVSPTTGSNLFGVEPGKFINSAKIFIEAGTSLENYLGTNSVAQIYTITIWASVADNQAVSISGTFTVQITPVANHRPYLASPSPYSPYLSLPEDAEETRLLVTVCANDSDSNLDLTSMCRSLKYTDFYTFNDPSSNFYANDTGICSTVLNSTTPPYTAAQFCIQIWTRNGAIWSLRNEAKSYALQVGFRDTYNPPAWLHVFFNVSIVAKEPEFWRYCFICNRTSCPATGTGPSARCLPGQHYCCKRVVNAGSRLFQQTDRFCSSIKADSSVNQVNCCGNNYCNPATKPEFAVLAVFMSFLIFVGSMSQN